MLPKGFGRFIDFFLGLDEATERGSIISKQTKLGVKKVIFLNNETK